MTLRPIWFLPFLATAIIFGFSASAQPAHEHGGEAHVDADGTFKLGFDRNFRSGNARSVLTDVYGEFEGVAKLFVRPEFYFQTKLHWERVKFPTESRIFGGHGLYLENLFVNYGAEDARVYAGKFNPNFGMGWDDAKLPGFYANEFAKDYQMKEAIGAGGTYGADLAALGKHKVDIAGFFIDNTSLDRSLFNNPGYGPGQGPLSTTQRLGQNKLAYGGPGNTSGPQSLAVQYELADPAGLEGLTAGVGYRFLKAGSRQPATLQAATGPVASRDSHGYVAGARYEIGLPLDVVATPFVEWAKFTDVFNADPQIGTNQFKDRTYLTTAAIFTWRDFTLIGSRMTRTFAKPDNAAVNGAFYNQEDRQLAGNLLYKVLENLTLGIGYRKTRAVPAFGDVNRQAVTHSFGTQAVYTMEF
ncbi:MAG: hypothetical protein HY059_20400 [Proteobacteria bacterium]|nr:hypothetical protein [Pseudomonadota bacterium]